MGPHISQATEASLTGAAAAFERIIRGLSDWTEPWFGRRLDRLQRGYKEWPELAKRLRPRIEEFCNAPAPEMPEMGKLALLDPALDKGRWKFSSPEASEFASVFPLLWHQRWMRAVAYALLAEAMDSRAPADSLQMLAAGDIGAALDRALLYQAAAGKHRSLYTPSELAAHVRAFIDFLQRHRGAIIATGVPGQTFDACPLLHYRLGGVYPTGPDVLARRFQEFKASVLEPKLAVEALGEFLLIWSEGMAAHTTGSERPMADLWCELDSTRARRIEADRYRVLDMNITVLYAILECLEGKDGAALLEKCLRTLVNALRADDLEFYLQVDYIYTGGNVRAGTFGNLDSWKNPGAITHLIDFIVACDSEMALGTASIVQKTLCRLDGYPSSPHLSYFDYVGATGQEVIDAAFAQVRDRSQSLFKHHVGIRDRMLRAFETDFHVPVSVPKGLVAYIERVLVPTFHREGSQPLGPSVPAVLQAGAANLLPVDHDRTSPLHDPPSSAPSIPPHPASPRTPITGWRDIASALQRPYSKRRWIKSLNDRYGGPIRNSGKGTQPMVDQAMLLEWWDRLAIRQQEQENQSAGKKISGDIQHGYGRDGVAAPAVNGHVKKRRLKPT